MKCPHCGVELEGDSKFCTNCGKGLDTIVEPATTAPVAPTPEATPAEPVQPAQPAQAVPAPVAAPKKSHKTLFIVLGIVGGVILLFIIGIVAVLFTVFKTVSSEIDPVTTDPYDYTYTSEKEEIKSVKDPTGHEIKIVKDSITKVTVDLDYLYSAADKKQEKAKKLTEDQIDASKATDVQKLAMKKALKLISYGALSKQDLEKRLKDESFDDATIKYAVENLGLDWDEQAEIEITELLAAGGSSKQELIDILEVRGYDPKKAKTLVEKMNPDFYEQAVEEACFERFYMGYDKSQTSKSLEYDGFTSAEITFALKTVYDELEA